MYIVRKENLNPLSRVYVVGLIKEVLREVLIHALCSEFATLTLKKKMTAAVQLCF